MSARGEETMSAWDEALTEAQRRARHVAADAKFREAMERARLLGLERVAAGVVREPCTERPLPVRPDVMMRRACALADL